MKDKDIQSVKKRSKQLERQADSILKKGKKKTIKKTKITKHTNEIPKKYPVYIKSKWWTLRKEKYYKTHRKVCAACGSTKYINLHHMIYQDFGNEEDGTLIPLCNSCHTEFHDEYATGYNMFLETYKFIDKKQACG